MLGEHRKLNPAELSYRKNSLTAHRSIHLKLPPGTTANCCVMSHTHPDVACSKKWFHSRKKRHSICISLLQTKSPNVFLFLYSSFQNIGLVKSQAVEMFKETLNFSDGRESHFLLMWEDLINTIKEKEWQNCVARRWHLVCSSWELGILEVAFRKSEAGKTWPWGEVRFPSNAGSKKTVSGAGGGRS